MLLCLLGCAQSPSGSAPLSNPTTAPTSDAAVEPEGLDASLSDAQARPDTSTGANTDAARGSPADAGAESADAAMPLDASAETDGSVPDSGVPHSDVPDSGVPDSGVPDSGVPDTAAAPAPRFTVVQSYAVIIPGHNDPADIYYPVASGDQRFPTALLLQGANVARGNYQSFARRVAAHGFLVVVPDHAGLVGLFAEEQQVLDTLPFMVSEGARSDAPIFGRVDTQKLTLLGHSFGGVAGLFATQNVCSFPFCATSFVRPVELSAAAFYGTNMGAMPAAIMNAPVAVALVQGALDGKALPAEAEATYAQLAPVARALFTIAGANHYGITNSNNPAGAEADPSAPSGVLSEQIEAAADAAGVFLRASALGDLECQAWLRATTGKTSGLTAVKAVLP